MSLQMYETLYISQPELAEEEAETLGGNFKEVIEDSGGKLVKSACWGKRKLAYSVRKFSEGYYFHLQFEAPPTLLAELERRLRNNEQILKFLSVRLDRRAVTALAAAEKKAAEKAAARAQREAERAQRQKEQEEAAGDATEESASKADAQEPSVEPPAEPSSPEPAGDSKE